MTFACPLLSVSTLPRISALALAASLAACGGGGSDNAEPATGFTVGGTLSGLTSGKSLVLQNNASDNLSLNANGNFVFASPLASGSAYAVTIKTQPTGQLCSVGQGSGTATANVANVQVNCQDVVAGRYTLGGQVTGLQAGTTLVLQNNGADALSVTANGGFTFAASVATGSAYAVTVKTQPQGQNCTVTAGSGTASANVGGVTVACAAQASGPIDFSGDWGQNFCSPAGTGTTARNLVRPTRLSDTSIDMVQGVVLYNNSNCAGTGTVNALSSYGTVNFTSSQSNASLSASWGTWTFITGASRVVWAKKGSTTLCIFGDANPTLFPNLDSVESAVNLQGQSTACYTKR